MENWRRFVNESENESGGLVDISAGPDVVLQAVPQLLADPELKNIVTSGRGDGDIPDEIIEINPDVKKASDLRPTQAEIGSVQSLKDQSEDNFGNLDRAIAGGKLGSKAGLFPILVFQNFILDGHHRWSQFMTTNPNAMVDVAEISAPGVSDPKTALALLHYMNFALFGQSPTKDFQGDNVYNMSYDDIYQQALGWMAESTVQKLSKANLIPEPTKEAAAKHFADNLSKIPGPGQFSRTKMPQPGDAGSPDGYATTPELAAQGAINYDDPKKSDAG